MFIDAPFARADSGRRDVRRSAPVMISPPVPSIPPAGSPDALIGDATAEARPTRRRWMPARAAHADVRFAIAGLIALAGLLLTWLLLVGTETGQRLENAALRGAEFRSDADQQAALDRLAQISIAVFAVAVVVCFAVGQLRKRGWLATLVVGVMGGSVLLAELLKDALGRPELVSGPVWLLRNSFPSGSAAIATAVAVGAILVSPDRLRWLVLPFGVAFAAIISEAVQTSGWHRLSDSIGSSCLVIAVAMGGLLILARNGLVQESDRGGVDHRVSGSLSVVAGIALALGTFVLVLIALFPLLMTPIEARRALLQTAFPLIGTGWTIVAIVAVARVIGPFTLGGRSKRPTSRSADLTS